MKTNIEEWDNGTNVNLEAETLQEAALLARIGMNGKQKVIFSSWVNEDGRFSLYAFFEKRKDHSSLIGNRKNAA